ncbi:MAG TPA: hypothetical protein VE888_06330, partial [Streptosporangiaceae bacterium]|nr:hypothetical protein [Streptosporangiaceae bacterium]
KTLRDHGRGAISERISMIATSLLLHAVVTLRDHGNTNPATAIAKIDAPDPPIHCGCLLLEMPA